MRWPQQTTGQVQYSGGLLLALGTILVGDIWGAATGFRNLQARFYSGPVWTYRIIGLVGVVSPTSPISLNRRFSGRTTLLSSYGLSRYSSRCRVSSRISMSRFTSLPAYGLIDALAKSFTPELNRLLAPKYVDERRQAQIRNQGCRPFCDHAAWAPFNPFLACSVSKGGAPLTLGPTSNCLSCDLIAGVRPLPGGIVTKTERSEALPGRIQAKSIGVVTGNVLPH